MIVKRVITAGEMELKVGMDTSQIIAEAAQILDRCRISESFGDILFEAEDGRVYAGTIEFVISAANHEYEDASL